MALQYAHPDCPASAFICPLVGTAAPLQTWGDPILLTYTVSTGSPHAPETIPPNTPILTLVGGTTFDRTTSDWVVISLVGLAALRVVKVADVANLDGLITTSDYALLAWVKSDRLDLWQAA